MYTDKKKKRWPKMVLAAVVLILAVAFARWVSVVPGRDVAETGAEAVKAAVQRCALQCYAVEGVYPTDLSYLEEHYGLQVNRAKFTIIYDVFASNLPPNIRVIPREQ